MDFEASRVAVAFVTKVTEELFDIFVDSFDVSFQTAVHCEARRAELALKWFVGCLVNPRVLSQTLCVVEALLADVAGGCSDLVVNLLNVSNQVLVHPELLVARFTAERFQLLVNNHDVLLDAAA